MDDNERPWGVPETSAYLGVPEATLYQRRHRSYGPRDRRVGRYVRHDPGEVRAWSAAQDEDRIPIER